MTKTQKKIKRFCDFNSRDNWFCLFPWKGLSLRCDGKIGCGCSGLNKHVIGDIHKQGLKNIWNNSLIHEIRKYQKGSIEKPPKGFCNECDPFPLYKSDVEESFLPDKLNIESRLPIEYLMVETTAYCNLNCPGCYCRDGFALSERSRKKLPFADFKKVIDEIKTGLKSIHFYLFGEPFANNEIFNMVEYARNTIPNVYMIASTNGHFFNSDASRIKAVSCGLDEIIFSIDGSSQNNYEKYRQGGNLKKVLENLTALVNKKNRLKKDTLKIIWRYILFNWNDSDREMQKALKISKAIGVDKFLWHITSWPEESVSKRFVPDHEDFKLIIDDLDPLTGSFYYGYYANK